MVTGRALILAAGVLRLKSPAALARRKSFFWRHTLSFSLALSLSHYAKILSSFVTFSLSSPVLLGKVGWCVSAALWQHVPRRRYFFKLHVQTCNMKWRARSLLKKNFKSAVLLCFHVCACSVLKEIRNGLVYFLNIDLIVLYVIHKHTLFFKAKYHCQMIWFHKANLT